MKDEGYHSGTSQRGCGEALVLPLKAQFHVGDDGIDYGVGVRTWERHFGTQMELLQEINDGLDYDIFQLHELWEREAPTRG